MRDPFKRFRRKPTYTHKEVLLNLTAAYWTGLLLYKIIEREWYTIDQIITRVAVWLFLIALVLLHYFIRKYKKHSMTLNTRVKDPNSLRIFLIITGGVLITLDIIVLSRIL